VAEVERGLVGLAVAVVALVFEDRGAGWGEELLRPGDGQGILVAVVGGLVEVVVDAGLEAHRIDFPDGWRSTAAWTSAASRYSRQPHGYWGHIP
jgi:hypothetical protein